MTTGSNFISSTELESALGVDSTDNEGSDSDSVSRLESSMRNPLWGSEGICFFMLAEREREEQLSQTQHYIKLGKHANYKQKLVSREARKRNLAVSIRNMRKLIQLGRQCQNSTKCIE